MPKTKHLARFAARTIMCGSTASNSLVASAQANITQLTATTIITNKITKLTWTLHPHLNVLWRIMVNIHVHVNIFQLGAVHSVSLWLCIFTDRWKYSSKSYKMPLTSFPTSAKLTAEIMQLKSMPFCIISSLMLEYAWYSAGLIEDRDIFSNVSDAIFPQKLSICDKCQSTGFAKCSLCRECFCFACYYDTFYPCICEKYLTNV